MMVMLSRKLVQIDLFSRPSSPHFVISFSFYRIEIFELIGWAVSVMKHFWVPSLKYWQPCMPLAVTQLRPCWIFHSCAGFGGTFQTIAYLGVGQWNAGCVRGSPPCVRERWTVDGMELWDLSGYEMESWWWKQAVMMMETQAFRS